MNLLFVCFSSAVAALAAETSAASVAGADVAVLLERPADLNEGNKQLQADPRRLADGDPQPCSQKFASNTPNVTATFSETKLQASFTCGSPYTQGFIPAFSPDANSVDKCCADANKNAESTIQTVLGVKGKADKTEQKVTVTLEKIPDAKRGQSIYYKCKNSDESDVCVVALKLPPEIGQNDCAIDKVITVPLKQTVSSADFKCVGGKMDLEPFEVSSGKCSNNKKTTNAATVTNVSGVAGEFKVTVDQRPNQTEELCYTCSYDQVPSVENTQTTTTRTCSVIVTVEAAASSTSTVTTTSSAQSIVMTSAALSTLTGLLLTVVFN
ncbi:hypothetical protein CSUI_002331 [Cystoisospora suis]|uniref:Uncharacterized protein n=1 Tax=Cystoisospora suis TaxID=483139 RepID=A0A2C6L547_9APIC|nr:hypothetical protein CSUI_002331 [Cystoisospora suis]